MKISASPSTPVQPPARRCARADPLSCLPAGDMWVFAYGSLMWNPGFPHVQARRAQVHGYHRALCVWSWVHRGTQARPGLVLGLDRGGSCVGVAHRVAVRERDAVIAYLYERELVTHVYIPVVGRVRVDGVGIVPALTFAVDRRHPQYAGQLSAAEAAKTIHCAHGRSGPNPEYFANTIAHMDELGIRCPHLLAIQRALAGD
ncbi:MAG: gamma-glutamylcyclotransferase [Lysobacterales bacterium]|nr:MAG: gamma-glutamylcyclotransferase [Xanthomonadales bacterium]